MSTFCVMPWYSNEINLQTGKQSVCCWLRDDISRHDLQTMFLQNKKPTACSKCWEAENSGIESRRLMENRFLDFKLNKDLEKLEQDARNGLTEICLYQIYIGSLCNSTCVTCGPVASTAWKQLTNQLNSIRIENQTVSDRFTQLENQINWKNIRRINLVGGEPLLIKQSFAILEKLLEHQNHDCRVSFVTNGSVTPTPQQIDLFSQFSDISACVSIDGIDSMFEYIRYPLDWKTVCHNLGIYKKIFNEIVVSFTVSNLNYHAREEIISWFRSQDLLYIENFVHDPAWFDHRVGPGHDLWPRFVQEIRRQDELKGIKIADYVPYIADMIGHQP